MTKRFTFIVGSAAIFAALCSGSGDDDHGPILPRLSSSPLQVVSTVPANGDVNPYGVAFVPHDFASGGSIHPDDVLVSNFNGSGNLQGTGTTIVSISPGGTQSLFFQAHKGWDYRPRWEFCGAVSFWWVMCRLRMACRTRLDKDR